MEASCCENTCGSKKATADPIYRRILWAALLINGTMFLVEIAAGIAGRSVSLKADALDFLADAANYGVSLFVLGLALHWRARAALLKGASLGILGLWVIGSTVLNAVRGTLPTAEVMGVVGVLALLANVAVAAMLFAWRRGDSNMRSVWLCSRNDAIANMMVVLAACGVWASGTGWPDIAVAAIIASLSLTAAWQVIRQASTELRLNRMPAAAE